MEGFVWIYDSCSAKYYSLQLFFICLYPSFIKIKLFSKQSISFNSMVPNL